MKLLKKFLLVLLGSLLLLEAATRLATPTLEARIPAFYYRQYLSALLDFDEVFVWSGRPGAEAEIENPLGVKIKYRINSNGWRGREFMPLTQLGNALVLGDSFSFGLGVQEEERYNEQLEKRLRGVNVWSFSHMGYAPDQYGLLGLRWFTAFPWAFVVIQLSNNDVQDVAGHSWGYVGGSGLPATISPPASYFFFSGFSRAWDLAMSFAVSGKLSEGEAREGLKRLLHSLEKNLSLARELKIPVFLVQASDWGEPAYGKAIAEEYKAGVVVLAAKYDAQLLEANKDFTSELMPAPDLHWTAATHARVADALFERVKLLPSFQPPKPVPGKKKK